MKTLRTIARKAGLKYKWFMLIFVAISVVLSLLLVANNWVRGEMSEAVLYEEMRTFFLFLGLVTGILVVRALLSAIATIMLVKFSAQGGYNLRKYFVNHFLRMPFSKLEKSTSGENLSVYSNDLPVAESFVTSNITSIIGDVAAFIASLAFILYINPRFTGILFLVSIGIGVLVGLIALPSSWADKKASEKEAKFNAVVSDSLQNLSVVAAYSLEDRLEKRYLKAYWEYFKFAKLVYMTMVPMLIFTMVALIAPITIINMVVGLSAIDGYVTVAEFFAFSATAQFTFFGLMKVAMDIGEFVTSTGRAKRLIETTAYELENLQSGEKLSSGLGGISFEDVVFAYEKIEKEKEKGKDKEKEEEKEKEENTTITALDGVSFTIKAGSKIAIVGESGSGKSTILKLLLGLYQPQSGKIIIGGVDTATLALGELRNHFAYVPQDSFLFPHSIGKNITLEDEIADMPRLVQACENAGIMDFINSLPEKFDSILTEASENISGGQRQRIAMARAFYKNAPVILFDEATSSLDPTTEAAILETFDTASAGKTVIIIAHRKQAIAGCDTIIAMSGGKIADISEVTA